MLEAEHLRVRKAIELSSAPPSKESLAEVAISYLAHQRHVLTPKEYERQVLILETHIEPFFPGKIAEVRRADIQRLAASRSPDVPSPQSARNRTSWSTFSI